MCAPEEDRGLDVVEEKEEMLPESGASSCFYGYFLLLPLVLAKTVKQWGQVGVHVLSRACSNILRCTTTVRTASVNLKCEQRRSRCIMWQANILAFGIPHMMVSATGIPHTRTLLSTATD